VSLFFFLLRDQGVRHVSLLFRDIPRMVCETTTSPPVGTYFLLLAGDPGVDGITLVVDDGPSQGWARAHKSLFFFIEIEPVCILTE
jgi:hypothetical protein